jgi:ATP-dependent DNA ligase
MLMSKNGKPLHRYFPEVQRAVEAAVPAGTVVDGEIVSPEGFEALQLRLHPAASRIARLSVESPCRLVLFDLLAVEGQSLMGQPLGNRRQRLEHLLSTRDATSTVSLGQATRSLKTAKAWLGRDGTDGIVAKRLDVAYTPGERMMLKYKVWKSYDCVVGGLGFRAGEAEHLLLGLYDDDGLLHYVGRARLGAEANKVAELFEPLLGGAGFTGKAPAQESRWGDKKTIFRPVEPRVVAEVSAQHVTSAYMRHGARFLRWRPDKSPQSCTLDQLGGR